jgi:hypothetical protein
MLEFFDDGRMWCKGTPFDLNGRLCLAACHDQFAMPLEMGTAWPFLQRALPKNATSLVSFNDHAKSYARIKALILRAQVLASRSIEEAVPYDARRRSRAA